MRFKESNNNGCNIVHAYIRMRDFFLTLATLFKIVSEQIYIKKL